MAFYHIVLAAGLIAMQLKRLCFYTPKLKLEALFYWLNSNFLHFGCCMMYILIFENSLFPQITILTTFQPIRSDPRMVPVLMSYLPTCQTTLFQTTSSMMKNLTKMVIIWIQGISPIAKTVIAISISIFIKFEIAIAISIAILKKIADRDRSFAIADLLTNLFTYC